MEPTFVLFNRLNHKQFQAMLELLAFALLQLSIFSDSSGEIQSQDASDTKPNTTTNSAHGLGGWCDEG
ncbi:hypothetical protein CDA63_12950 [Hymenobacter amundsenii]|uniref:Uncharacterized protein n=1 Tax=Hymenobacter amundsenii TaxID=2006685 RepID=A0A246FJD7_9BACT|nr:hypothetical protein CDA63_12950 [Hymenobacter amundsenii]